MKECDNSKIHISKVERIRQTKKERKKDLKTWDYRSSKSYK